MQRKARTTEDPIVASLNKWRDRVPGWVFALFGLIFLGHGVHELVSREWFQGVLDTLLGVLVIWFGIGKHMAERADRASARDA